MAVLTDAFIRSAAQHLANPNLLKSMLKNKQGGVLSPPLSGEMSSATAQGYLPQYRGAAAASLAPSIIGANTPSRKFEKNFISGNNGRSNRTNSRASNRTENRAPSRMTTADDDDMRAADLLRRIREQDTAILNQSWNSKTKGIGPIHGSDW